MTRIRMFPSASENLTEAEANAIYLRLDASNDPVIPATYLEVSDGVTVNQHLRLYAVGRLESRLPGAGGVNWRSTAGAIGPNKFVIETELAKATLGTETNHSLVFKTNNVDRMLIEGDGTITQLSQMATNITFDADTRQVHNTQVDDLSSQTTMDWLAI